MAALETRQGHGHVTPLQGGIKARCGGPATCAACRAELERLTPEDRTTAVGRILEK